MAELMIRPAAVGDARGMARCIVDTWLAAHRGQMPDVLWEKRRDEWTYEVSETAWAETLRDHEATAGSRVCIRVAEDESGEIVALAMGKPGDGRPEVGEIAAIYVRENQQGRGLGRQLLEVVAADLADAGMPVLQVAVLAANEPAREFYTHLGGRIVEERAFDEEGTLLPEVVYGWPAGY